VTENLSYDLTDFLDASGTEASPLTTLSGSFTVNFDPTQYYSGTTTGLTVYGSSFPNIGSQLAFAWDPTYSVLSFGGLQNGPGDIASGTNDFVVQFNLSNLSQPRLSLCSDPGFSCGNLQGNSSYTASGYTLAAYPNDFWLSLAGSASSVPEPGTLALLGAAGFGMLLSQRRRVFQRMGFSNALLPIRSYRGAAH